MSARRVAVVWILVGIAGCSEGVSPAPSATAPSTSSSSVPVVSAAIAPPTSTPVLPDEPSDGSIDRLVADLDKHRLWQNGHVKRIELSADTPIEALVVEVFGPPVEEGVPMPPHRIVESREVTIVGKKFRAVRVDMEGKKQIGLMRFENGRWWNRVFPAE